MKKIIFFDFDSTVITKESLDEVIVQALERHPDLMLKKQLIEKVENITNLGMNGELDFCESVNQRLETVPLTKSHFINTGNYLCDYLTPGVLELFDFLKNHDWDIYIVSGGFLPSILPVAEVLKIPQNRVFAQEALFDEDDNCIGVDSNNLLFSNLGKGPIIDFVIKQNYQAYKKTELITFLVGDGSNDLRAYLDKKVDNFIGFGGNVERALVKKTAPFFVTNILDIENVVKEMTS